MKPRTSVKQLLRDAQGHEAGKMRISLLPQSGPAKPGRSPLIIQTDESPQSRPTIQLIEGAEYRYEIELPHKNVKRLTTDRPEVFYPDNERGLTGRLRTGLYVGTLPIRVFSDDQEVGSLELEVRSRKLNYLKDYQWMLRDIAEQMTEVVMSRFAAAEHHFSADHSRDAATLYQRFAFLKSLISGDVFQAALHEIMTRPHVAWEEVRECVQPGRGLRADSSVARQLTRAAGPRAVWPGGLLKTIPVKLERRRTEVTVDTVPNRFVKYALEKWRSVVARIGVLLEKKDGSGPVDRGRAEVAETLDQLDAILAEELFREVGRLDQFPASNQVLQKREGYRDLYRAYIQFEVASKLAWAGGDEVYRAGKRDVATLYEYWVFLQLAMTLSKLCHSPFRFESLLETDGDGLNVQLKAGNHRVLKGQVKRLGRLIDIEFWYNKTFAKSSSGDASWSRTMRPDYSLKVSSNSSNSAPFHPVWIHFDAKYRLDSLHEAFGGVNGDAPDKSYDEDVSGSSARALRSDLLKMHAYRDAIHRSAGAYVLYPGTEQEVLSEYHELLPGLGAFALRPSESGVADGMSSVRSFVDDVLNHVASQMSQHERGRFWRWEVYGKESDLALDTHAVSFLERPAADTSVLLGYVKSEAQWEWVQENRSYNLRAGHRRGAIDLDARELGAELVLLSCPSIGRIRIAKVVGGPEIKDANQMTLAKYPNPKGTYLCLGLEWIDDGVEHLGLSTKSVEALRDKLNPVKGSPAVVTWDQLILGCAEKQDD